MGESHIKQELPDTCTLIERYKFFSTKLHHYSSFDEFVTDLQHKSNLCNFLERDNILRDIIILKVGELNEDGLLPLLKDTLTTPEIVSLCRDIIPLKYVGDSSEFYGKVEITDVDDGKPLSDVKPDIKHEENTTKNPSTARKPHVTKSSFKCFFCDVTYKTLNSVQRHARKTHPEAYKTPSTKTWTCVFCTKTFPTKRELKTHEKTRCGWNDAENGDTYSCPSCTKRFKTRDQIEQHKRRYHDIVNCGQCQEPFTRQELYQHRKRVHNQQPFDGECKICHKHFTPRSLNAHMERHRYRKLLSDPDADPEFMARMKRKLLASKPKVTNVQCYICGKVYRFQRSLMEHLRNHMNVKNYSCQICSKRFVNSNGLASHLKSHSNTPTLKCRICDKLFKHHASRSEHEKIHLGIKPYRCSFCDKSFTCHSTRKYHERLHTGECPFKCAHCDKAFAQPNGLKSHMKTHASEGTS